MPMMPNFSSVMLVMLILMLPVMPNFNAEHMPLPVMPIL
jgi:hypothetical protein